MQPLRIAILLSALLTLSGSTAFAQGWDDPQAEATAERQQAEAAQTRMRAQVPAMMDPREAQAKALERLSGRPTQPEPEAKWRVVPDANGQPMVIQDTRGAAPAYEGGFGKVGQEDPNHGLAPLNQEMLLQHMQASQAGNKMWENVGDKGFFGGIKPPTKPIEIDQEQLSVPSTSTGPAWGKDKIDKMHHYVDGQEHHGSEDPHGFF
jgi:hypothetical protein